MSESTKPNGAHPEDGRPRIALTMGDVAGIGPEIVARACANASVRASCDPLVIGCCEVLERAVRLIGSHLRVDRVESPVRGRADNGAISCWNPLSDRSTADLSTVVPGRLDARAGRAAYECLIAAIKAARDQSVDAIVTAPLNKAALHLAGLKYPGHTEILAEACGVANYAMMLYVPPGDTVRSPRGLGVAHVTLHTSLASVPKLLTTARIAEKIGLVDQFLRRVGVSQPRVGVCALNPHAGEEGIFGDEERLLIEPAVQRALDEGIAATGPIAADALIRRALSGEFDGVLAMYHDQGHIPIKLVARESAVNVTLGLPIVRTSPSHGTAFDIAWKGTASAEGMSAAIQVAAMLVRSRQCAPATK